MEVSLSEHSGFSRKPAATVAGRPATTAGRDRRYTDWQTRAAPHLWLVKEPRATRWHDIHTRLVQLGRQRAAHERELCHCLLEADRLAVHAHAGYASLKEYADRVLGLSARQTEERLRVGRALRDLPELDRALATGELCWSVVRELTRVATAGSEHSWREWARGRRTQEVEQAVAARQNGDEPGDPGDASRVRHRLSFDVRAETMALFRQLQDTVRKELGESGEPVDDDTLLFEIARRALGGSADEGRASYQVAVTRCERCDRASIDAGGRVHPVDDSLAEMMECDAQHLGHIDGGARQHVGTIDGGAHQHVGHIGGGDARQSAPQPVAPRRPRSQPGAAQLHTAGLPTTQPESPQPCPQAGDARGTATHPVPPPLDDSPGHGAHPPRPQLPRATQTIPPATRRAVVRRHHGRCAVPGCRHHRFIDIHHIDLRSEGGTHNPDRLTTLCGAHHRAVHRGYLQVDGTASAGFRFYHADGRAYGQPLEPAAIDLTRQVLIALTNLGFKRTQAEHLIQQVQRCGAPRDVSGFLREALRAYEPSPDQ